MFKMFDSSVFQIFCYAVFYEVEITIYHFARSEPQVFIRYTPKYLLVFIVLCTANFSWFSDLSYVRWFCLLGTKVFHHFLIDKLMPQIRVLIMFLHLSPFCS